MIYPDLGFVLSLLARGDETPAACALLRDIELPLSLSIVHRLQIENGFVRALHSEDPVHAGAARESALLWRQYLHEQVFRIDAFDLDWAFARASEWNVIFAGAPPRWSVLVHPAVALAGKATFASFNQTLRKLASEAGLKLLPKRL